MGFYKDSLNGKITLMQTFGDSPVDVSEESQDRIFNSELRVGDLCIKASDDLPNHAVTVGSNISLFVVFSDGQSREDAFNKLSEGGKILFPIDGDFSLVMDPFEVRWMLVYQYD